ncbi:MAG: TonB-dependent receptor [Vicinamibacteria bacterium]|nr:TonB-dependent receptor [Vicinamibacteria bacterium]
MRKLTTFVALLLLVVLAVPASAQSLTGTIGGMVKDEQGGALPGVTVTLIAKTGTRTTQTDGSGAYRFIALEPGTYAVKAELSGFAPREASNVQLTIGRNADVDFALKVGQQTETITVVGEAPVVDTTTSASDQTLGQDLLFNLPIRPSNAAVSLMNYLPGINGGSAFGGDSDTGNALLLDGVDTRDPEGGSAWTFFNFNIVEEVQVAGLGAPAEYGSFTGAVVNTVTRSGGNQFGGLFDVIYSDDSLAGDNITAEQIAQNGALRDPQKVTALLDFTTQFSGPLIKDKLFFFASAQRFHREQDPPGAVTLRDEVSPRFNVKLTYQPSANDTFTGTLQIDHYNIIGRTGVPALLATDELTNREDAPEVVYGLQWRHLFGSKTFAEVKFMGWSGYFDLNPEVNKPGHFDGATGLYSDSQGWYAYYDRARNQVNASVSHFAEGWGKHDLKFGIEIERSNVRNRYGYVNDIFFYDYTSYYDKGRYLAYDYGYDIEGDNARESFYVQDSWKVSDRLTINPGLRYDMVRGYPAGNSASAGDDKVYDTKNFAPRVGFAYDLTGDGKTVLRGHYGQYYEGAFFLTFSGAIPGIDDFVLYDVSGGTPVEIDRSPTSLYRMDPDIKHPRVDEITASFERALGNDWKISATGVMREDKNLQASVLPSARWAPVTLTNALGGTSTAYRWVNIAASENDRLITNPTGFQYKDAAGNVIGTADAYRKYKGLILTLDKRFTKRWQARLSYVVSKSEGTVDNTGFNSFGTGTEFETPTRALVNWDGNLTNDRTHEVKLFMTYEIPKVDIGLSTFIRSVSGQTWTPFQQFSSSQINYPLSSGRRVFLEERGNRREDRENIIDLRLEKIFRIGTGKDRLSVFANVENLLNSDLVTAVNSRAPNVSIAGVDDPISLGGPLSVTPPRQWQFGARWSF